METIHLFLKYIRMLLPVFSAVSCILLVVFSLSDSITREERKLKLVAAGLRFSLPGGEACGYDGGKRLKGRKRHIVTDTQGLLLAVSVHSANEHDSTKLLSVFRVG